MVRGLSTAWQCPKRATSRSRLPGRTLWTMAEYKLSAAVREAGADLRGLREARGMSTRALAEAAGISSHSRVAEAERGVRRLSDDEYLRWMDALDLTAEDRERIL